MNNTIRAEKPIYSYITCDGTANIFKNRSRNIRSNKPSAYGCLNSETKVVTMISKDIVTSDLSRFKNNISKLDQIAKLPENWNENGARPFSDKLVDLCKKILNILTDQPEIFPTAASSIQMEYEKDSGDYLEFNISEKTIEIFKMDAFGEESSSSLEISDSLMISNKKQLRRFVGDFYGRDQ